MHVLMRWKRMAAVVVLVVPLAACTDLMGPDDPRYESECVVYVAGDASMSEIKAEIRRQLTSEQRARCRPPHVRMVTFG